MFTTDAISWKTHEIIGKYDLLKSAMVGSTHYAAVRKTIFATETEPESVEVFAAITLTRIDNKDYYNFAYKDMDETMGPCEGKCPKAILDLLTPTEYEYAKEWRKRCYENIMKNMTQHISSSVHFGRWLMMQVIFLRNISQIIMRL